MAYPSAAPAPAAPVIAAGPIPRHVAIIMDGNGRWARERHLPRPLGHRSGMKAVREVVEGAIEAGVSVLSLFAFSQENWHRPAAEVGALMALLEEYIARETAELHSRGVRVRVLGDLRRLTPPAAAAVERIMSVTAANDRTITISNFTLEVAEVVSVSAATPFEKAPLGARLESTRPVRSVAPLRAPRPRLAAVASDRRA